MPRTRWHPATPQAFRSPAPPSALFDQPEGGNGSREQMIFFGKTAPEAAAAATGGGRREVRRTNGDAEGGAGGAGQNVGCQSRRPGH
jgi:hypothetical protein